MGPRQAVGVAAAAASDDLDGYVAGVGATLAPTMTAGRQLLAAFTRSPGLIHAALRTPIGWRWFVEFCRGERGFESALRHRTIRAALRALT